jgi:uncharacterized protein
MTDLYTPKTKHTIAIISLVFITLVSIFIINSRDIETDPVQIFSKKYPGFNIEVADTPKERGMGLSGRSKEDFKQDDVLFFIFDTPGDYGFWMKDMLFPIDIVWFDESMNIVHVEQNVLPESYPKIFHSPIPALFSALMSQKIVNN